MNLALQVLFGIFYIYILGAAKNDTVSCYVVQRNKPPPIHCRWNSRSNSSGPIALYAMCEEEEDEENEEEGGAKNAEAGDAEEALPRPPPMNAVPLRSWATRERSLRTTPRSSKEKSSSWPSLPSSLPHPDWRRTLISSSMPLWVSLELPSS